MVQSVIIQDILLDLGIPPNLLGFKYLAYAGMLFLISDDDFSRKITKTLYVEIAKEYNTSPECVERCIRHAISVCWADRNEMADYMFSKYPTNSQFLSRIYYYVHNQVH